MEFINIYGKKRNIKKKFNKYKTYKDTNKVPCILYGKKLNIPFSSSLKELKKIVYSRKLHWIIIKLEGYNEKIKAITKEVQFDPIKDQIIHIDFYKINEKIPIVIDVPIIFIGRSIGVSKGGEYYSSIKKIKIKSLPKNIPNCIKLNISEMDIGDKIMVKDLLNDKYRILHSNNTLIARVKTSRSIQENEDKNNEKEEEKKVNKK